MVAADKIACYKYFHFFIKSYGYHLDLHSFPTRRSSDLREYAGLLCTGDTNFARDSMDVYAPATTPHMSAKGMFALLLDDDRSEEHTSELQSHSDLVCRLLLEKKKKKENRETCNTKK